LSAGRKRKGSAKKNEEQKKEDPRRTINLPEGNKNKEGKTRSHNKTLRYSSDGGQKLIRGAKRSIDMVEEQITAASGGASRNKKREA